MIIFNGKGVLVAIAASLVLALFAGLFHLNFGLSTIFAGIAGFFASIKLTNKESGFFGLPSFFFVPTHVYALLIVYVGIMAFKKETSFFAEKEKEDVREQYVEKDLDTLQANELSGMKDEARELKAFMNEIIIHQLKPEKISYLLKENPKTNAVLLLVNYDKFDEFSEESRGEFVSTLKSYFKENSYYADKYFYIGVIDEHMMRTTETPEKGRTVKSYLAYNKDLVGFYGETETYTN